MGPDRELTFDHLASGSFFEEFALRDDRFRPRTLSNSDIDHLK